MCGIHHTIKLSTDNQYQSGKTIPTQHRPEPEKEWAHWPFPHITNTVNHRLLLARDLHLWRVICLWSCVGLSFGSFQKMVKWCQHACFWPTSSSEQSWLTHFKDKPWRDCKRAQERRKARADPASVLDPSDCSVPLFLPTSPAKQNDSGSRPAGKQLADSPHIECEKNAYETWSNKVDSFSTVAWAWPWVHCHKSIHCPCGIHWKRKHRPGRGNRSEKPS